MIESIDQARINQLVRNCGRTILEFPRKELQIFSQFDENKKSNLDLLISNLLTDGLLKILDVPVISEEDATHNETDRPYVHWLIDPIDGTRSYLEGFHTYVTQIALMSAGQPIMSAVYAPALNDLYTASKGKGALKNGHQIPKSTRVAPISIIDNYPAPGSSLQQIMSDMSISKYIECGSIGLKICKVSDGSADLFIKDTRVHDWDIAPGDLILNEAGGRLGLKDAKPYQYWGSFRKEGLIATATSEIFELCISRFKL